MNKLSGSANKSASISESRIAERIQLVTRPKQMQMPDFGIVAFESRHAPGFSGRLRNDFSKFHLVIAGRAVWEGGGSSYEVGPDTLFHVPSGMPHSVTDLPHTPVILYVIHYRPELLDREAHEQLSALCLLPLDLSKASLNQALAIRSLYREMLFEQDAQRTGWRMFLRSCLMNLAIRTLRMVEPDLAMPKLQFGAGRESAERVAHYALTLRWHFYHEQTLAQAARSVHLSERRFTKLFRQINGQSWHKYLQSLRLSHAVKLLTETDKPISAVAFESGFEDLSHFHHVFKAAYHCSPLKYRDRALGANKEKGSDGRG